MDASVTLSPPVASSAMCVVLTGNPNCGKTTLFNALTGLRAKVGNYAGVTVERKEGRLLGSSADAPITILDLPGTYSLSPQSLDEQISRDVLFQKISEVPSPALVVVVVDASNLERNLYYATQVIELGYPTVLALNMLDVAAENGHEIDPGLLSKELGVPVFPLVASRTEGIPELKNFISQNASLPAARSLPGKSCPLPPLLEEEVERIRSCLALTRGREQLGRAEALLLITDERMATGEQARYSAELVKEIAAARARLEEHGFDWRSVAIEARYQWVGKIQRDVSTFTITEGETLSDRLDRVLTHKFWGMLVFLLIMAVIFQSIFTFAQYPMDWLEQGVAWAGDKVGAWIPPGDLHSLVVDGVIAGVGAVVVFLPQICLLFLFIGLLEDTGYMARAAFLMDRLMSKVGLHGKSFIPMLSSFACAIPGIMATRTIESPKDRLVTILVAPLMSCSARLPVYTLLIAACIPARKVFGFYNLQGLTMLSMYLLGIVMALLMAWFFKKTLLRGETPLLIMELPPYKRPVIKAVLRHMWDRSQLFLRRAGTVILGISILLWFLATYPRLDNGSVQENENVSVVSDAINRGGLVLSATESNEDSAGAQLRHSFAGRLGHLIEPAIEPLGFDWKIGIGLVASFAAREVFVSTMSTVYNVADSSGSEEGNERLATVLKEQKRPDGTPVYTTLVGVTLMVFYVFALQCVSTVAVVRRETNSWRWPLFQLLYMGALAWVMAFITYQGGKWLGLG
ncbi:MAG: ferrous iron transport protein B [Verrucomicrobiota bacterium]|nr:ferrous iron transport protein B [Verrucomicrobiota bacterium]